MRKVRVVCADPLATDSSSDEEALTFPEKKKKRVSNSKGKIFVSEILIPDPAETDLVNVSTVEMTAASSSRGEDEAPIQDHRSFDSKKQPGVRVTRWGKWRAIIWDPLEKTTRWLGTYNTEEEAVDAYCKKKKEYQSLMKEEMEDISDSEQDTQPLKTKRLSSFYQTKVDSLVLSVRDRLRSLNSPVIDSNNESGGYATVTDSPNFLVKKNKNYPGVRQCGSARWQARIWYGCSNVNLGFFETEEEAADAYIKARMERDSKKAKRKHDFREVRKSMMKGKGMKSKYCIEGASGDRVTGTEEDHRKAALSSKECEFGSLVLPKTEWLAHEDCNFGKKSLEVEGINCTEGMVQHQSNDKSMDDLRPSTSSFNFPNNESRADDPTTDSPGSLVMKKKYRGIRPTSSGRWSARIKFGKSVLHLGTFDTAEEAADAYARVRKERDSKKRKQNFDMEGVCKTVMKKSKLSASEVCPGTNEDHGDAETAPMVSPKTEWEPQQGCNAGKENFEFESQGLTCEAENSGDTAQSSREMVDSYTGVVRDWVMLDLLLADGNEEDPGLGIVDSNGQFIGEYSRLDDQLWFCRHGEDEDGDANFGSCGYAAMVFSDDQDCDYKPAQLEQNRWASFEVDMGATSVG